MRWVSSFIVVASVLVPALTVQVPLKSIHSWKDEHPASHNPTVTEWSLDKLPNPEGTDHLVFETVHSLLQHWPNTRMRNGHNIVPGIIPKGTIFYHGTDHDELPLGPEWVATDPEHSYFFCRVHMAALLPLEQGCWHFTLAATRPLKVIYFDGNSAAKLPYGPLDTQDLLAWDGFLPDDLWEESVRIENLCKWGKNVGVDGFVRMEMDFEIILCDLTSGVRVVSLTNLERPSDPAPSRPVMFEVIHAGSWHNYVPGETRIQLDLAGFISFYDTQLVPSLVASRVGQERWDHRVANLSREDFLAARSRLEAALIRPPDQSSGIDWKSLIQVIVDRFSSRFELLRHLLDSSVVHPAEIVDLATKTQMQLRIMLTPYILFSATPTDPSDMADLDWSVPIYRLCATAYTSSIVSELDSMTDSEKLLLRAVRGTSREICRVVTKMWAAGVYAGIDASLNVKESLDIADVIHVWNAWAEELNRLMTWLDWSVWVKCDPGCGPEELCYLPTWPLGFPRMSNAPGPSLIDSDRSRRARLKTLGLRTMITESRVNGNWDVIMPETDEWMRPQPKCIGRFVPRVYY